MMKHKGCFLLFFSTILYLYSSFTLASCELSQKDGYVASMQTITMPLAGTLSVPPDTANGSVIYQQRINLASLGKVRVNCTNSGQYYTDFGYFNNPALSVWGNNVYDSGFPGIGIRFFLTASATGPGGYFPVTVATSNCLNAVACEFGSGWSTGSSFQLIKIANNITPGVIYGSNLPVTTYSFGQSGDLVNVFRISLSGSMTVTVPTCNISLTSQTLTVNMGKNDIHTVAVPGEESTWKDASIQLVNCGTFYGNSEGPNWMATFTPDGTTRYALNPNTVEVLLLPMNGTDDAANGIMSIDDHPLKATGVGIQLSRTQSEAGKIDLNNKISNVLPQDGTDTVTIPLYARYIQTASTITAGKANGRLEYVITYQ